MTYFTIFRRFTIWRRAYWKRKTKYVCEFWWKKIRRHRDCIQSPAAVPASLPFFDVYYLFIYAWSSSSSSSSYHPQHIYYRPTERAIVGNRRSAVTFGRGDKNFNRIPVNVLFLSGAGRSLTPPSSLVGRGTRRFGHKSITIIPHIIIP